MPNLLISQETPEAFHDRLADEVFVNLRQMTFMLLEHGCDLQTVWVNRRWERSRWVK